MGRYEYEVTQSRIENYSGGRIRGSRKKEWELVSTAFGVMGGIGYIFFTWRRESLTTEKDPAVLTPEEDEKYRFCRY